MTPVRSALALLALLAAGGAGSQAVRLPVVADTCVSSYPSERPLNYGGREVVRVKGLEMMLLARFDLAPLAGRRAVSARFYCRPVQHRFRTLGFSTIAADWTEGAGRGEEGDRGTCFDARADADGNLLPWARPGGDFTDVAFGAGGTLCGYGEIRDEGNGWISAPVPAELIDALAAGLSDGLCLTDETGQTRSNNDVYTRERRGSEPYLLVETAPDEPVRIELRDLVVTPSAEHASFAGGAAELRFQVVGERLIVPFELSVNGTPLPRWRLPRLRGGANRIVLDSLPPEAPLGVAVRVGERRATASGRASASLPRLTLPSVVRPSDAAPAGSVFAVPGIESVHPLTGALRDDQLPAARRRNSVWSSAGIGLAGARGEAVIVQLVAESDAPPAAFVAGDGLPAGWLRTYGVWYVTDGEPSAEYAVPSAQPLAALPGQRFWPLLVEVQIPADAAPGEYHATWRYGGAELPVTLTVWRHALPDALTFDVSLNSYGRVHGQWGIQDGASDAALAIETAYHRLAHRLRCTWAPLQYSHGSRLEWGAAPALSGDGADVTCDFADYDRRWGALLDGTAFANLPRAGVPLDHAYLPFCEGWPSSMTEYRYQPTVTAYPELIAEHGLRAPPIGEAFSEAYRARFRAVVRAWAEHAARWPRTSFQAYFNNKYYYKDPAQGGRGTSWWLLDEPMHRDDWLALRFFAGLVQAGSQNGFPTLRFDISRPQWQRDWLDGFGGTYVVGGEFYRYNRRVRAWAAREGATIWTYGSAAPVRASHLANVAWCLKAWLAGADGVVPWNSVGGDESFERPSETALMVPGRRFGLSEPVASLRLLALRQGQQECERLRLVADKLGASREQLAEAAAGLVDLEAQVRQRFLDEAAPLDFSSLSPSALEALRASLAAILEAP